MTLLVLIARENDYVFWADTRGCSVDNTTDQLIQYHEQSKKLFYSGKHKICIGIAGDANVSDPRDSDNPSKKLCVAGIMKAFTTHIDTLSVADNPSLAQTLHTTFYNFIQRTYPEYITQFNGIEFLHGGFDFSTADTPTTIISKWKLGEEPRTLRYDPDQIAANQPFYLLNQNYSGSFITLLDAFISTKYTSGGVINEAVRLAYLSSELGDKLQCTSLGFLKEHINADLQYEFIGKYFVSIQSTTEEATGLQILFTPDKLYKQLESDEFPAYDKSITHGEHIQQVLKGEVIYYDQDGQPLTPRSALRRPAPAPQSSPDLIDEDPPRFDHPLDEGPQARPAPHPSNGSSSSLTPPGRQ